MCAWKISVKSTGAKAAHKRMLKSTSERLSSLEINLMLEGIIDSIVSDFFNKIWQKMI